MALSRFVEKEKKKKACTLFYFFFFYFSGFWGAAPQQTLRQCSKSSQAEPARLGAPETPSKMPAVGGVWLRDQPAMARGGEKTEGYFFFQEFFSWARKDKKKKIALSFFAPGPQPGPGLHPQPCPRLLWSLGYLAPPTKSYLLGLLAKIKCSICSYQLNLWYVTHGVTRV